MSFSVPGFSSTNKKNNTIREKKNKDKLYNQQLIEHISYKSKNT